MELLLQNLSMRKKISNYLFLSKIVKIQIKKKRGRKFFSRYYSNSIAIIFKIKWFLSEFIINIFIVDVFFVIFISLR